MNINDALKNVTKLAVDTAPIIYYVENHPGYADLMQAVVDALDDKILNIVGSSLLLMEVLVQPIKLEIRSSKKSMKQFYSVAMDFR